MGSGYGSLNRQINNRVGGIKKSAPYQPLAPIQEEEEIVSLYSAFDTEEDAFEIEQPQNVDGQPWVSGGPDNFNADGIDLNARVATNSYGGALKYSQLSAEDQAVVDARRATGQGASIKAYDPLGDMAAVRYGSGTQYDTADEAINGLSSFLGGLADNSVATDAKYNLGQYDPSQFAMAGVSAKGGVSGRASTDAAIEYLTKNDVPMSIEVDGQTRYLTTGLSDDVLYGTLGEEALNATNGNDGGSFQDFGEVGTYSTIHVKPESVWAGMPLPLRIGLGLLTSGGSEAFIAGTKGIAGETLHAGDYLSIALPALEYANILVPPVDAVSADIAKGIEAAPAVAGKGVLGLGYNSSKALLTGVVTGDPVEAVTEAYGPALVKKALDGVGVGEALNTFASNNNINADDLNAGINKTLNSLAKGDDIEDALLKGVGKYVLEGGTILPDVVEDALGDVAKKIGDLVEPVTTALSTINKDYIKPVTSKAGDVLSAIDTEARVQLSALDDYAIQPLTSEIGDVLSQADTAVRQGAAAFDKEVLQPFTQPAGDVIEDVAQATGDVAEDVGQEVGDALSAAETAVRQALGDIDLPDGPDIDLPDIDIDLPNIGLGMLTGASTLSPTRTTDDIFKEDLFKFKTKIEVSPIEQLLRSPQARQQQQEVVGLYDDPFASSFDERNTFQL